MCYDFLPWGAPRTQFYEIGDMPDLCNVFGIVECDVTCPDDIFHPVLSTHENRKLVSSLRPKIKQCFTSVELQTALEMGYKVTRVYRIDHYQKSNEMFKSYINLFMKLKMESGEAITDTTELAEIQTSLGFVPDFSAGPNPGRKAIAKLMLNSLWGKFGQNIDNCEQQWLERAAWYKLLGRLKRSEVEIHCCEPQGENWLFTKWNLVDDTSNVTLHNTNVALCAFVTGNARLRLWAELNKLGDRALYCDTDSIIYEYDPRLYNIPESRMLGGWEPEPCGDLKEFAASGKKAYSYIAVSGKSDTKHKGVTITARNSEAINFDGIKKMAIDSDHKIGTSKLLFERTPHGMRTRMTNKDCKNTVTTRAVVGGVYTLPFGHKDLHEFSF
jgi:hypothetical protein